MPFSPASSAVQTPRSVIRPLTNRAGVTSKPGLAAGLPGAAVMLGQGADAFLGTQGDPWDTQSDMAMALIGALAGQILLGGWHDRQLARIGGGLRRSW